MIRTLVFGIFIIIGLVYVIREIYILYLKISFRYYQRRFYKRLKKLEHWVDYQLKKEETKE
jgi:hypothetical protein